MRLCALSVDLDEVPCYAAIHGLRMPDPACAHAIYREAVPRWEAWLDQLGIRATFFVVGRDLEHAVARDAVMRLHAAGHEIANHSFEHRYDFSRRAPQSVARDVQRAQDALQALTGVRPLGFRAPGYVITDTVFEILSELGLRYDSSVFPCPAYYTAKAVAIGAIALRGRRSSSLVDDPRVLTAPADPYRAGVPYHKRGLGLLELPIGVTSDRTGRLPFIGTSLVLAGRAGSAWLARQIAGRPLVNLEAHGIDLSDAEADGLQFLAPHQRDLRRELRDKRAALEAAVWTLRGAGYEFATLAQVAERAQACAGG